MDLLAAMRVFCDVAEQGRLTLSAASRGVNPSVLSRQISALAVSYTHLTLPTSDLV